MENKINLCVTIDTEGDAASNPNSTYIGTRSAIPKMVETFDKLGIKATFFIQEDRICQVGSRFADIWKSLEEKEILLKEIHHRVKNNLQIISSLLDLQVDTLEIPRDSKVLKVFQESKDRIRSMTLIHENLYQAGDLVRIDVPEYIRDLVDHFINTYGSLMERITPRLQVDHISLNMDIAIPIGLILSELITNALKHAFPHDEKGEITYSFVCPKNLGARIVH